MEATVRRAFKALVYDATSAAPMYAVSEPGVLSEDARRTKN